MKVTIFGSKNFDSLEYHLSDSYSFLGHNVFHLDIIDLVPIPYKYNYFASKFLPGYDDFLFKKAANLIIDSNPDLIICTYRFINPICIKIIKGNLPNAKVIHINPDQLTTLEYQQIFLSNYDAYFTKDHYMCDFMKNKLDLNVFYLPEAFNYRIHKPLDINRFTLEEITDIDVIAFGTIYPYRSKMLSELIKKGVNISIYGTSDKRFSCYEIQSNFKNEFITGKRKAELLLGSKIVFNNFHFAEIESVNVKFFEISGIGGFQICDYKPVMKEYTNIDLSKFTFKNINEAYDLIKYYLNKPSLRHQLAQEQREYFLENHTYEHRINKIFELIF